MRLLTALLLAAAIIIPGSATLRASENRHNGYYVATDGDDASKGTLRRPFRTIARALAEAHAGDTVFVRGGTYREQVVFPASGRADARIVLKAYGNERPVISGEGIAVEGRTDMLLIRGRSHITVEGLEITALGTAEAGREANGIVVEAGSTDITPARQPYTLDTQHGPARDLPERPCHTSDREYGAGHATHHGRGQPHTRLCHGHLGGRHHKRLRRRFPASRATRYSAARTAPATRREDMPPTATPT
ncbi:MAG: DUF1565 domain-containing protein [Bacteroidales bacterium]|nr:MAG: DUF1565 domain-containing protein [Bacteroidales bacterium]